MQGGAFGGGFSSMPSDLNNEIATFDFQVIDDQEGIMLSQNIDQVEDQPYQQDDDDLQQKFKDKGEQAVQKMKENASEAKKKMQEASKKFSKKFSEFF